MFAEVSREFPELQLPGVQRVNPRTLVAPTLGELNAGVIVVRSSIGRVYRFLVKIDGRADLASRLKSLVIIARPFLAVRVILVESGILPRLKDYAMPRTRQC